MKKVNERLIDALEKNCGYLSGRHDKWPIAYNVKIGRIKTDPDTLLALAKADDMIPHATTEWHPDVLEHLEKHEDGFDYEFELEMMREGVSDDDTYRTYSPKTAARFGLPYYNKRVYARRDATKLAYYHIGKGDWALVNPYSCKYFDVKFGFAGRSGGYIVIEEFEGRTLRGMSTEDLTDMLQDRSESTYMTNEWCRNLLAMMYEWDQCFTPEIATKELQYQITSRIASMHNEAVDADEARTQEQSEVSYWQTRDVMTEAA